MSHYVFDQRLRSLLLEALSYIEVSVRNQWSYHLVQSSANGEFAHLDPELFNPRYYGGNLQEMERSYDAVRGRGGQTFQTASIWDVLPTMSFGSLSKWYSSVNGRYIRQAIANSYGVDEVVFRSILRHLTSVRNTCAHHERMWNRTIEPGLKLPRQLAGSKESALAFNTSTGKVYNALVIVTHLMEVINPNEDWPQRLIVFIESDAYRAVPRRSMGFLEDWLDFTIWRRHLPPGGEGAPRH